MSSSKSVVYFKNLFRVMQNNVRLYMKRSLIALLNAHLHNVLLYIAFLEFAQVARATSFTAN